MGDLPNRCPKRPLIRRASPCAIPEQPDRPRMGFRYNRSRSQRPIMSIMFDSPNRSNSACLFSGGRLVRKDHIFGAAESIGGGEKSAHFRPSRRITGDRFFLTVKGTDDHDRPTQACRYALVSRGGRPTRRAGPSVADPRMTRGEGGSLGLLPTGQHSRGTGPCDRSGDSKHSGGFGVDGAGMRTRLDS